VFFARKGGHGHWRYGGVIADDGNVLCFDLLAVAMLAILLWAICISYAIERKAGITGWHGCQDGLPVFRVRLARQDDQNGYARQARLPFRPRRRFAASAR
jgi:hypothetical protein